MEVAKSVSLKINIGNFQSVDLFCSVKADATAETAEKVGAELHKFCVKEITKDRNASLKYLAGLVAEEAKKELLNSEL